MWSLVEPLPRLPSEGGVQGGKCNKSSREWLSGRAAAAQKPPVGRGTIKEHLPRIQVSLASILSTKT